jgi:hypothetical protein
VQRGRVACRFQRGWIAGDPIGGDGGKVSSENAVLGCKELILEQELLIDQAGDEGQQTSPFVVCHEEHPS